MGFNLGFLFILNFPKVLDAQVFELGWALASLFALLVFFLDVLPFTRNPCPHSHPQRLRRMSLLILLYIFELPCLPKFFSNTLLGVFLVVWLLKTGTQLLGSFLSSFLRQSPCTLSMNEHLQIV